MECCLALIGFRAVGFELLILKSPCEILRAFCRCKLASTFAAVCAATINPKP